MTDQIVKLASLKSKLAAEREGEWIEVKQWPTLGPVPIAFLVRSTNYPPYVAAHAAEQKRIAKRYDGDTVPSDVAARLEGSLYARYLLLGWRGLDMEHSSEAAEEVLCDEAFRIVRDMVFWAATRVGLLQVEFIETEAKN